MTLRGRTLFITGGSRGIGKAIALRAAREGANVAIAAKTSDPHPRLAGTIHETAAEVEAAGGRALALMTDVRDENQVAEAIAQTAAAFGGIDIVVNNASAIQLTGTLQTPMKRFDLMFGVNVRGTFATTQAALPWLLKSDHAHVLTLSPPLNMEARWFGPHCAYTMSKFGMSMVVLGLAEEFKGRVGVNALWPRTTIATAAVEMLGGAPLFEASRSPEIIADAAHWILTSDPRNVSGQFFIDEDLLRSQGVTDFERYAMTPGVEPTPDFFV